MPDAEPTEKPITAIYHKRLGWLTAPEGYRFRVNESGKSYELVGGPDVEPTSAFFPFGTRWLVTSIYAEGD